GQHREGEDGQEEGEEREERATGRGSIGAMHRRSGGGGHRDIGSRRRGATLAPELPPFRRRVGQGPAAAAEGRPITGGAAPAWPKRRARRARSSRSWSRASSAGRARGGC